MSNWRLQQALELLKENQKILAEPWTLKPHPVAYDLIIIDARDVHHYFLIEPDGSLFYDGWCMPADDH